MPGLDSGLGSGSVGLDRLLLERLRHSSVDVIERAGRIRSHDAHSADALATLHQTSHFLTDAWLPTIDELLALDTFTRPVAGTGHTIVTPLPSSSRAASTEARGWGLPRLLAAVADIGRLWPSTNSARAELADLTERDRAQIAELLRRLTADPDLLAQLLDDPRHTDAHLLRVLGAAAADGHLDAANAIRIAASIAFVGPPPSTVDSGIARHGQLLAHLHARLGELAADPVLALASLEHAPVREWLVLAPPDDATAISTFLGAGIWGAVQIDPTLRDRSRHVWLEFVDLADRHASSAFSAGVADGLAIGAVAHLTDIRVDDAGGVADLDGDPIPHDGDRLTADDLRTLIGPVVAVPSAAQLLADFVERTAIADITQAITVLDDADVRPDLLPAALRESTARAAGLLDLVFDDSIDHQHHRWADQADADAAGRASLTTVLNTLISIAPAGAVLTGTTKTLLRTGVTTVSKRAGPDREIARPVDATLLDTQLGVQVAVSIADSPALRDLLDVDVLAPSTRRALRELADAPPAEVTDLRTLLADVIDDDADRLILSGTIHEIVSATSAELDPHRD